jgi:hypothetical protein
LQELLVARSGEEHLPSECEIITTCEAPSTTGGMVISNAANGQANVKALVYVAAFAPEAGENAGDLNSKFPGSLVGSALAPPVPLPGGGHDLYVQQEKFHDAFAPDVPADAARLAAAAQRRVTDIAFSEPATEPAWKTIPSCFVTAIRDTALPPKLHAFMAGRARCRHRPSRFATDWLRRNTSMI